MVFLRLALWPAFLVANVKRQPIATLASCFVVSAVWLTCSLACLYIADSQGVWHGPARRGTPVLFIDIFPVFLFNAVAFTASGFCCGVIFHSMMPLPRIGARASASGFIVGMIISFSVRIQADIVQIATPIIWLIAPIAAVYSSAFIQRRRVKRFRTGRCVNCNYEGVGRQERCTECGCAPHHMCYKCRHVVDARPGGPCPKCKAPIAQQCWQCGYDWAGAPEAPRCPECGVWKPVTERV